MTSVVSRNGIPIRLPDERWAHIMEEHAELAGMLPLVVAAVAEPERILAGGSGELLAESRWKWESGSWSPTGNWIRMASSSRHS